jgi:hypothetical protein
MKFLEILETDKNNYERYKNLSEDQKIKFEKNYKRTFRYQFFELNYYMRKYKKKMEE